MKMRYHVVLSNRLADELEVANSIIELKINTGHMSILENVPS
jgi:hypothetical protein